MGGGYASVDSIKIYKYILKYNVKLSKERGYISDIYILDILVFC